MFCKNCTALRAVWRLQVPGVGRQCKAKIRLRSVLSQGQSKVAAANDMCLFSCIPVPVHAKTHSSAFGKTSYWRHALDHLEQAFKRRLNEKKLKGARL